MTLEEMIKTLNKLPTYYIELGIYSANTQRKQEKLEQKLKQQNGVKARFGLTNAEIMFINEYGSPVRHIPKRPVLHYTLEFAKTELALKWLPKAINAYIKSNNIEDFERELKKFCLVVEKHARAIIIKKDPRLKPNAPSVAKAKGGNYPLHDTGQLARSITCQLVTTRTQQA